jgi:hypothetical protein
MSDWAYPGADCVCINDASENGLRLPIRRGKRYTIAQVFDNPFISKVGSSITVALAEVKDKRNEFWLDRFEPAQKLDHMADILNRAWKQVR